MRLVRLLVVAVLLAGLAPDPTQLQARGTALAQRVAPFGASTVRIGQLRDGKYEVVTLPLEVYVGRVLAGEAAPNSPPASLEALAIAIRTYTLTNKGRHGADGFDLCDQTHCQVMRTANAATDRAAVATAEQVLLFRGAPATVFYSASCGGRSEKPSNVWPAADDPSYLSIHDDDGCGGFPAWSAELALSDLQRALRAGGYTGTLRDVRIVSRNDSGRVARLAVDGMSPAEISGQDLRMVVGRALGFQHLQSTQFDLRRSGSAVRFTGRGAGHGVGLCVIGSMKLAANGQSATTILARYFPGTTIGSYGARVTAIPDEPPIIAAPEVPRVAAPAPPTIAAPPVAAAAPATDDGAVDGIRVLIAGSDPGDRAALLAAVRQQRQSVAAALGEPARPLTVRVLESNEAYERASGRPWFTLGAASADEMLLTPLWFLRERGMLERTLRRALVRQAVEPVLPARPAWIREGAAVHFADPDAVATSRPPCPGDAELEQPTSPGALGEALARAHACFDRQFAGGRDWRKLR
ncbi:MAG: SpoIID/LytB domain-containing protein [Vicinamibacterales bacterium]